MTGKKLFDELSKERYDIKNARVVAESPDGKEFDVKEVSLDEDTNTIVLTLAERP